MTYQSYCYLDKNEVDSLKKESLTVNRQFRRRLNRFLARKRIKRLLHENYVFSMSCLIGLTENNLAIDNNNIKMSSERIVGCPK